MSGGNDVPWKNLGNTCASDECERVPAPGSIAHAPHQSKRGMSGADLRTACLYVAQAELRLRNLRFARDEAIRAALAEGVPYAALQEESGLSRGQLDAIRRGKRRR